MKHIRQELKMNGGRFASKCGKKLKLADAKNTVTAALESDCDDCRIAVKIACINDTMYGGKKAGVRKAPEYTPQPMKDGKGRIE